MNKAKRQPKARKAGRALTQNLVVQTKARRARGQPARLLLRHGWELTDDARADERRWLDW